MGMDVPARRRLALAIATALLALLAVPSLAAACSGADRVPTASTLDEAERATRCLVNQERAERGLARLRASNRLESAARAYARDMVRRDFFSHTSPDGETLVDRLARASSLVGENLAWGSRSRATPRSIVRSWMGSPGHRANILRGGFRRFGAGVAAGAPVAVDGRAATYVLHFGG
jgi:uncharacterized protein YkwD